MSRFARFVYRLIVIGLVLLPSAHPGLTHAGRALTPPDVIFYNGDLLTMEGDDWSAQAIAVQGDQIVAVGSDDDVLALRGEQTRLIDLNGHVLMPGFVDAHAHMFEQAYAGSVYGDFAGIQAFALSVGKTTMGEAFVTPEMAEDLSAFDAAGQLRIRLSLYLLYTDNCGVLQGDWYRQYSPTFTPGEMLRIGGVKIFTDGGSCGIPAFSYEHPVRGYGDLWFTQDQLTAMVAQLDAEGYPMMIHALGDRAIEQVLNAYEALFATQPNTLHHRIEHNTVVPPDMLGRYSQIDAIPTIFGAYPACNPLISPPPVANQPWEWPWRALLDANPGVRFAWHSDYPVTPASPLLNLYSLVTPYEVDPNGVDICPTPDWLLPNKTLTVREVLPMMTINAAYALRRENEVGSLTPGKYADLIILSDNPLKVDPAAIKDIQVWMTMVSGEVVYCGAPDETLCLAGESSVSPALTPNPQTVYEAPPGNLSSSRNLALGQPAAASQTLENAPAWMAVDGDPETVWMAGESAPQWIEIDLGQPRTIHTIRLTVAQYPAGATAHRVYGRGPDEDYRLLVEFSGDTVDGQVLEYSPRLKWVGMRYVKIETVSSPSWIAWREVDILR